MAYLENNVVSMDIGLAEFSANVNYWENIGAGNQYSLNPSVVGSMRWNKCILSEDYNGEDLNFGFSCSFYSIPPAPGDQIRIRVRYLFYKPGDNLDPYADRDGQVVVNIPIDSYDPDRGYQIMLGESNRLNGKEGATHLQITCERLGNSGSDNYGSSVDVYQFGALKIIE
jgi:hypothetical protein